MKEESPNIRETVNMFDAFRIMNVGRKQHYTECHKLAINRLHLLFYSTIQLELQKLLECRQTFAVAGTLYPVTNSVSLALLGKYCKTLTESLCGRQSHVLYILAPRKREAEVYDRTNKKVSGSTSCRFIS